MKYFFISILFFFLSCEQKNNNCIEEISFNRVLEGPSPDLIKLKVKLFKEDEKLLDEKKFTKLNFYINEENCFSTHDWLVEKQSENYIFYIRTTFFYRKKNFKETDFNNLIKSKDLKVDFNINSKKIILYKCD
jgi:hypothetical protein